MIPHPTTPAGHAYRDAWSAYKEAFYNFAPPAEIDRLGDLLCAARDALRAPVGRVA